jgi:Divergent InlB B-repeat domain
MSTLPRFSIFAIIFAIVGFLPHATLSASQAYGTINNFDVVNDTGVPCHGFEIELDDISSAQVTYTYDWNHYGTPVITTDSVDPNHPKTYVRYLAKYTNGAWSAYTAVPTNVIAPTMGHQFTDPSVNFGGEHFGVGYTVNPTNVLYHWLQDDGTGNLKVGPAVSVSTPVFNYIAPAVPAAPPQIQPVIVPPPPPVPPVVVTEFGEATWVKMITTTTHTNNEVKLRDLVTADTNHPTVKGWANGEPAEVEFEWQVLQYDSGNTNGGNSILNGAPESLNHGDDVVTTRYEFYKYTGPYDPETHEALAQSVAKDGIHGLANTNGGADYSAEAIVGDFLGAQMSAAALKNPVGLIDHLQDGNVGNPYPDRLVAISGGGPMSVSLSGSLPKGLSLNTNAADTNCGLLSGTPQTGGAFQFRVTASDYVHPDVSKVYILNVAAPGVDLPAHAMASVTIAPAGSGTVTGTGDFLVGQNTTLSAQANNGYRFVGWSEAGIPLTNSTNYTLTINANHDLVASFTSSGVTNPPVTNPPATNPVVTNSQTITFQTPASVKLSDSPLTLSATASSGLPVAFAVVSGPASLSSGNHLVMTNLGSVIVRATQLGNSSWNAAPPVQNTIVVSKGDQTITLPPVSNHVFGDAPFPVNVPTSSASLPVSVSVLSGPAVWKSGKVTLTGAGTVTLAANQSGSKNWNAAPQVTAAFTVAQGAQSITFPPISDKVYGVKPFSPGKVVSSAKLPVSLSIRSGPAYLTNGMIGVTGAGMVSVVANSAGDANHLPASATNGFAVAKALQVITITAPKSVKLASGAFAVSASATSGQACTFSVAGPAALAGTNSIIPSGTGSVTITAVQAGSVNYLGATNSRTVTVAR